MLLAWSFFYVWRPLISASARGLLGTDAPAEYTILREEVADRRLAQVEPEPMG
jgi:hypothetical protein